MPTTSQVTDHEILYSAFISYAAPDKEKALQICESLEERGFRCWIAPRDVRAGQSYPDEIIRGIEQSRCLILVLSDAANKSVFVAREVERAVSHRKAVFPVRIEEVLPSRGLELLVSTVHWVDAWTGNLGAHMERLARDLQDDDVVEQVAQFSQKIRRRGLLPRWVMAAAAFVTLVIAIIVGNVLTGRLRPAPEQRHTIEQQGDPVRERFRNEMARLGVNFGSITKNDIQPFITGKILFPQIHFRMDERLKSVLTKYTDLSFAVGASPFKKSPGFDFIYVEVEERTGGEHSLAVNDLLSNNSLTIKYDLKYPATHQEGTIGPFAYPFHYRNELLQGIKQSALKQNHWANWVRGLPRVEQLLTAHPPVLGSGTWRLSVVKDCYPAIKRVFVGVQPDKLRLVKTLPEPPPLDDKQALMQAEVAYASAHLSESLPVPDNAPVIYVQLEFFDGSKSDIREQRRNN